MGRYFFLDASDESLDEEYEFNMINYCVISAFIKFFFFHFFALYPIVEHGRPMPSGAQSSSKSMKPSLYRMSPLDLCSAVQYTADQCTELQFSAVNCSSVQCSAVHCTALNCTALHFQPCH